MLPALLFGMSTLLGVGSSLYGAKQQSTEDKYNEKLKQDQARMIDEKIKITSEQADREIGRAGSTMISLVASSGITMSGSPANAFIDMTNQMEFDRKIAIFNLEWEKKGVISEADAYGRQSNTVKNVGYANAFSKALMGGYQFKTKF